MSANQCRNMQSLEGRVVHISLDDGSRLDAVSLVSARRNTLWIFDNGEDRFVPVDRVIDIWEAEAVRRAA